MKLSQCKSAFAKCIATYAVMYPAANVVQQKFILVKDANKPLDYKQTLRFLLFGVTVVAPMVFSWQILLVKIVPYKDFKFIALRVLLDQIIYAPVAITTFYAGLTALEGGSFSDIKNEITQKVPETYLKGLVYWTVIQSINFSFIRLQYRPMFVPVMGFFWTTFLSWSKSQPLKHEKR